MLAPTSLLIGIACVLGAVALTAIGLHAILSGRTLFKR